MSADIQFNVDQALQKLGELVAKHGPQAVDVAIQVVRVDAVGQLAMGGFALLVAAACAATALRCWSIARSKEVAWEVYREESDKFRYPTLYNDGKQAPRPTMPAGLEPEAVMGVSVGAAVVGSIAIVVALFGLIDPWAWVAVFSPKLALAHQVLAKFAGI